MKTISESKYSILMRCAEALVTIKADRNNYRLLNLQRQAKLIIKKKK